MNDSVEALVDDALQCILQECPAAYRAMAIALGPRRVDLDVDGESLELLFVPEATDETLQRQLTELGDEPSATSAAIKIQTSAASIHQILIGDRDALDAILADDIEVVASPEDLIRASEAGMLFVKGAVRCQSMPPLLSRLKRLATQKGDEHADDR
jgi:hypothetical protein